MTAHLARNVKAAFKITVSQGNSNSSLCLSSASQPTEIFHTRTRTPTTTILWVEWLGRTSPGGSGCCQAHLRRTGAWGGWRPTYSLGLQASPAAQHPMSPPYRPLLPSAVPSPPEASLKASEGTWKVLLSHHLPQVPAWARSRCCPGLTVGLWWGTGLSPLQFPHLKTGENSVSLMWRQITEWMHAHWIVPGWGALHISLLPLFLVHFHRVEAVWQLSRFCFVLF